jgi:hypothetical protein
MTGEPLKLAYAHLLGTRGASDHDKSDAIHVRDAAAILAVR